MQLIITEKPSAAKRIAQALAQGRVEQKNNKGVRYYHLKHKGTDITVVPAVGHLFSVGEKKKSFRYPSFDLEWKPTYTSKKSAYAKKYADTIRSQAKKADSFVVACDYDIEGEVIGLNAVRFLCGQEDAKRMKFSTLTKPDIIEAYEKASSTLDWGQAKAGETRHYLDWMWGINLSRALTLAIRKQKAYRTLSSGRVQGPALKILTEREKEIQAFVPETYWQLQLDGTVDANSIEAWHKEDKFWEEDKVDAVLKKTDGHDGTISNIKKSQYKQYAPHPFDLTSLQTEAYKVLGIPPKITLSMAQKLYSNGYISYPRTSSNQLSPKIGFAKIIGKLKKQQRYAELGQRLLNFKKLYPNNGKKKDPAHPAIYPTGVVPRKAKGGEAKLYDLIVKRFFATFAEPAERETLKVNIDVNAEPFILKGTKTTKKGWHEFYEPYLRFKEEELPPMKKGDQVRVKKIEKLEKETQPPRRYTPASIIKELEKRNLGTKATRANIVDSLYQRDYLKGKSIEVTKLGMKTIETLEKYSPEILDEDLTRNFEEQMEKIRQQKVEPEKVLQKAKEELTKLLEEFKEKEDKIGQELATSYRKTEKIRNFMGTCPVCKKGDLMLKKKRGSRFIACDQYPDCKTIFSVPNKGTIKRVEELCEECGYPQINIRRGRKNQTVCINKDCKSKKIDKNIKEKDCPKCDGKLVVKKSVYGQFLACNNYPKCKHTENIQD